MFRHVYSPPVPVLRDGPQEWEGEDMYEFAAVHPWVQHDIDIVLCLLNMKLQAELSRVEYYVSGIKNTMARAGAMLYSRDFPATARI